ncbi:MAG: bifunctional 4-hydroxy-2-oxoglutarate aldolase/2-dehydro-3-deoxy-phosphogluconate aldolase [bacterium]
MASSAVADALLRERVIAILRGIRSPRVEPVVEALRAAGLTFVEITVEAAGGIETLAALRSITPEDVHLGAGSIMTAAQAAEAHRAGAQYLVSPGLFDDVSEYARARDVLYIPGVLTGTEIGEALRRGHTILKLFPAGLMGPEYLRAMRAPYPQARLFAVGNIGINDVTTYLGAGAAGVAIGSQLAGRDDNPGVVGARARAVVAHIRNLTHA